MGTKEEIEAQNRQRHPRPVVVGGDPEPVKNTSTKTQTSIKASRKRG